MPTKPEEVGVSSQRLARIGEHWQRYIDAGKLAGTLTLMARRGQIVYCEPLGHLEIERRRPVTADSIWRIYSMTKPITSVGLMMLYEEGRFQLDDPVHKFIPSWKDLRVFAGGNHPVFATVPPARAMTVRDLLSHTSGLTYGFMERTNVDAAYRKLGVGDRAKPGYTLADMIDTLATLPLEFSPGTRWNYSVSTDVVGHLIEVISGQKLDAYLKQHVLEPLGMRDTGFVIADAQVPRFAANYERQADGRLEDDRRPRAEPVPPGEPSLRRRRARLDGARLLPLHRHAAQSRRARRRAPARAEDRRADDDEPPARRRRPDRARRGRACSRRPPMPASASASASRSCSRRRGRRCWARPGEHAWGGAASTAFWIDPAEDLIVIFMTQLMPSSSYPLRRELRVLTYAALVD